MKAISHAEATAAEMISKFGSDAKRKAIYLLVDAISASDKPGEHLMREVFHQIMLGEQKAAGRSPVPAQ